MLKNVEKNMLQKELNYFYKSLEKGNFLTVYGNWVSHDEKTIEYFKEMITYIEKKLKEGNELDID